MSGHIHLKHLLSTVLATGNKDTPIYTPSPLKALPSIRTDRKTREKHSSAINTTTGCGPAQHRNRNKSG